jgi:hypothetical protein
MGHELDEWFRVTDFVRRFGSAAISDLAPNKVKIDGTL